MYNGAFTRGGIQVDKPGWDTDSWAGNMVRWSRWIGVGWGESYCYSKDRLAGCLPKKDCVLEKHCRRNIKKKINLASLLPQRPDLVTCQDTCWRYLSIQLLGPQAMLYNFHRANDIEYIGYIITKIITLFIGLWGIVALPASPCPSLSQFLLHHLLTPDPLSDTQLYPTCCRALYYQSTQRREDPYRIIDSLTHGVCFIPV